MALYCLPILAWVTLLRSKLNFLQNLHFLYKQQALRVECLLPLKLQHSCGDGRFSLWTQSSYKLQNTGIYAENIVSFLFNDMTSHPFAADTSGLQPPLVSCLIRQPAFKTCWCFCLKPCTAAWLPITFARDFSGLKPRFV